MDRSKTIIQKEKEKTTRLNKYLAECGICSRREADRLIEEGRVTLDGRRATLGDTVGSVTKVLVNGKPVSGKNEKVVLAYYKPVGVVCTEKDTNADRKILDELRYPVRVTYAGRLDKESEGLMIMTNDGELIQAMMRGANRHEKEYIVKVKKEITPEFISKMSGGIYLPELEKTTRSCEVEAIGKYTFRIVLTQGLNRQIRRMCKECGQEVVSLKRIRIMNIPLDGLGNGAYRSLKAEEKAQLYYLCGLGEQI